MPQSNKCTSKAGTRRVSPDPAGGCQLTEELEYRSEDLMRHWLTLRMDDRNWKFAVLAEGLALRTLLAIAGSWRDSSF